MTNLESGGVRPAAVLETYVDRRGKHRARIRAANRLIIGVTSQGYADRRDLDRALTLMKDALNNEAST